MNVKEDKSLNLAGTWVAMIALITALFAWAFGV